MLQNCFFSFFVFEAHIHPWCERQCLWVSTHRGKINYRSGLFAHFRSFLFFLEHGERGKNKMDEPKILPPAFLLHHANPRTRTRFPPRKQRRLGRGWLPTMLPREREFRFPLDRSVSSACRTAFGWFINRIKYLRAIYSPRCLPAWILHYPPGGRVGNERNGSKEFR